MPNDWSQFVLPAVQQLLWGANPYNIYALTPPWTFFMLAPVGILPQRLALIMGSILPVAALVYAAWKKRKPYLIALVGMTFPFVELCVYGNVDWMVLLGVISINSVSPFLLTIKPQAGALAVIGQIGKMRGKSWKDYVRVFAPFVVIGGLLILLFPGYLHNIRIANTTVSRLANFSLFPYSLPLAFPLLWLAYKRGEPMYGALASLCISPYFYFHSIIPSVFLVADHNWKWGLVANLLTWVIFLMVIFKMLPITF